MRNPRQAGAAVAAVAALAVIVRPVDVGVVQQAVLSPAKLTWSQATHRAPGAAVAGVAALAVVVRPVHVGAVQRVVAHHHVPGGRVVHQAALQPGDLRTSLTRERPLLVHHLHLLAAELRLGDSAPSMKLLQPCVNSRQTLPWIYANARPARPQLAVSRRLRRHNGSSWCCSVSICLLLLGAVSYRHSSGLTCPVAESEMLSMKEALAGGFSHRLCLACCAARANIPGMLCCSTLRACCWWGL